MKALILIIAMSFAVSGCATLERFVDDIYDGDPRMTELKTDIDDLKAKAKALKIDIKTGLQSRLAILREEAEMLGDLKKAEFAIKYGEMKTQLETVRAVIGAGK